MPSLTVDYGTEHIIDECSQKCPLGKAEGTQIMNIPEDLLDDMPPVA